MRSIPFLAITQRAVVILYRRFVTDMVFFSRNVVKELPLRAALIAQKSAVPKFWHQSSSETKFMYFDVSVYLPPNASRLKRALCVSVPILSCLHSERNGFSGTSFVCRVMRSAHARY
jgi:hypothetical protein